MKTYHSPPLSVRDGVVGVLLPAAADANVPGGAIWEGASCVFPGNKARERLFSDRVDC